MSASDAEKGRVGHVAGDRVEVFFAGWDQWIAGSVKRTGEIQGIACACVQLDGYAKTSIHRLDQMRLQEGLFALLCEETK